MLKVYTYSGCSTCKQAVKFLKENDVKYSELPIRATPPTLAELKAMLKAQDGNIRKLFNTAGKDYRDQGLGAKLPDISEEQALALLNGNGNLVKRPFAIGKSTHLVGFNEEVWSKALTHSSL